MVPDLEPAATQGCAAARRVCCVSHPTIIVFAPMISLRIRRGRIFRGGNQTLKSLTPRPIDKEILSFRDSLSNSYPLPPGQRPVLAPGKKYMEFDSSEFPPGSVIFDHNPPGHVSVRGLSPEQLMDLVREVKKFEK